MTGEPKIINGDVKLILHRIGALEKSQNEGFVNVEKKIDDLSNKINESDKKSTERYHAVDKQATENKVDIKNACHDIEILEGKSNKNDVLAGIGAFVAAVLGAIGIATK